MPRLAASVAAGVLWLVAAGGLAALGYAATHPELYFSSLAGVLLYGIVPALAAAGAPAAVKLPHSARVNIALLIVSAGVALLLAETLLTFVVPLSGDLRRAAARAGVAFDARHERTVVDSMRRAGIPAYPAVTAGMLLRLPTYKGIDPFPLGGIANVVTVYCNESGQYAVYRSDGHGFNNLGPDWPSPPIDVVAPR